MLRITAIAPDPKEPDLRVIRSGRRRMARVRHVDIDALGLRVGETLSEPLLERLAVAERRAALRVRAVRSLSRAAASRRTLAARLARHGTEQEVQQVLDELTADGVLNDAQMAAQLVTETLRREPVGSRRLLQSLQRKGFDQDLSARVVAEAMQDRDGRRDVAEAAARAARGLHHLPHETATRRLAGRLARRGFDADEIRDAIRAILPEA